MRRIFSFFSVVALGLIVFGGCGVQDTFKDEPDLTSLTGVLEEQKSDDDYSGTHLIVDDDENVTPLRSLSINLSNQQYLSNKVQVMGFMNTDDDVFEVTGVSVLEVLDETYEKVEFVDYKNTDFGIQLKYYTDWELAEGGDVIVFFAPSVEEGEDVEYVDSIEIQQIPFTYSPTISEDGEEDSPLLAYASKHLPGSDYEFNQIGLDSLNALNVSGDLENTDYYLYRNGLIYKISFITSENYIASNKKVFNEMISDFRFTGFTVEEDFGLEEGDVLPEVQEEPEAVTPLPVLDISLTTFESLPYSFTAKYPSSWYYAGQRSSEPGVIHHYGFSDESITETNELISLDLISDAIPSGKNMALDGRDVVIVESGKVYSVYTEVGDYTYRVSGNKEYEGIVLVMAGSIVPADRE